jgi:RNA polymerase sigma factor (sigma-70 family)
MTARPDPLLQTRLTLLIRLKDLDDQDSWQEFYNAYARLIYGVALKAGLSDVEAQEALQQTMIGVARNIGEFEYDRKKGTFKSWLLHAARWKINDQLRRRREGASRFQRGRDQTARTATIERVPDPAGSALESIWEEEWEKQILDSAMERVKRQVKAKQYQMFDLYVVKHWPVRKVARTLDVNIGQVYLAKHRISLLLRRERKVLETKAL